MLVKLCLMMYMLFLNILLPQLENISVQFFLSFFISLFYFQMKKEKLNAS